MIRDEERELYRPIRAELESAKRSLENALDAFEKVNPKRETNGIESYNLIEFRAYDAVCRAIEKLEVYL